MRTALLLLILGGQSNPGLSQFIAGAIPQPDAVTERTFARQSGFKSAYIASEQNIAGTVRDENGAELPGVSIIIKGTQQGTVTNAAGKFALTVPGPESVLIFSFVGYISEEIMIGNRTIIDLSLKVDQKALEEIVVVGYGTQRKSDVTGALSVISNKEFSHQPVTRLDQVLQGRAAGVQVTQANGAPGDDARIRVRGANSVLGNNNPLYVIDGFVGADFNFLNPEDIETIQVLKDASATSIYGSRGANGVIIITTKKGTRGIKVNYEGQASISNVIKRYDILPAAEFAELVNARSTATGAAAPFTETQIQEFRRTGGTDWQDLVYRTGSGQQHQLSLSGGGDKTTFLISGNYLSQKGIVENNDFKRYILRTNLATEVTSKLSLRLNLFGTRTNSYDGGIYYWLTRFWGHVPLILTELYSEELLTIGKSSPAEIYDLIVADLKVAETNLPNSKRNPGRPNKGSAKAFLADVYLTMAGWPLKQTDKYDLAAAKAKEVIDSREVYGFELLPTFAAVFENDPASPGTAEAVYQISGFLGGSGTANATYGSTKMPGEEGGWDDMFAELNFFHEFPEGPRKSATFRTEFGLGATKIPWEQSLTKHPYYQKWYIKGNLVTSSISLPSVMMRYPHVLTIYAEAKARGTEGPDQAAYDALNQVRLRGREAGTEPLSPADGLTAAQFADEVVQERAWEFACERTRWFDLIRLEMVEEANARKHPDDLQPIKPITKESYWLPMPFADTSINPNLN